MYAVNGQWKDSSTSWEKLLDEKESHLLQITDYTVATGVGHEPSLNWWVPHMWTRCDAIIDLVQKHSARYLKYTHISDIECPKTVEDTL